MIAQAVALKQFELKIVFTAHGSRVLSNIGWSPWGAAIRSGHEIGCEFRRRWLTQPVVLLPIVERELQVASRKRGTFWVRVTAALVALAIGCGFLVFWTFLPSGFAGPRLGKGLFDTLTWLCFGFALATGLFFTSDCLSEEKREGTLGLLFLTDLRGFDVVLGKLLATSLRGAFALFAVFPILAVTFLMGGVTGAHFWLTVLALVSALFFSLATGLFVSALSRDAQRALSGTLGLLLLFLGAGPATDAALAGFNSRAFEPMMSFLSPGFLFLTAGAWGQAHFWAALGANQLVAWGLLVLTCVFVPHVWQEKVAKVSDTSGSWARWWTYGGVNRRANLRRKLLELNPVAWLVCRRRWQTVVLWLVAGTMVGGVGVSLVGPRQSVWLVAGSYVAGLLILIVYVGIAGQASRFFVEARHNGLIELLLVTPLTERQIVQGQWRAILRMWGPALALCLAAQLAGAFLMQQHVMRQVSVVSRTARSAPPAASVPGTTNAPIRTNTTVVTVAPGSSTRLALAGRASPFPHVLLSLASATVTVLKFVANLVALTWFGIWMGLRTKSVNLATLKTLLFVQVIPWFVIMFAAGLMVPLLLLPRFFRGAPARSSSWIYWYPLLSLLLTGLLALAKDVGFSLWARSKLYREFRLRAAPDETPSPALNRPRARHQPPPLLR